MCEGTALNYRPEGPRKVVVGREGDGPTGGKRGIMRVFLVIGKKWSCSPGHLSSHYRRRKHSPGCPVQMFHTPHNRLEVLALNLVPLAHLSG
ncbi:hypothetical protein Cadr_000000510 [Camelus dromedarius]|uniref:Uncharacterized protein n=1 Tax=Camelus dromedarius TaxID=9838 RepID=A0A5N4EL41_CAMDR|nr:hypothetical protein Cadr_000000510 [Camelus dromedarius]